MATTSQEGARWLRQELPGLVTAGVISAENAAALERHYSSVTPPSGTRGRNAGLVLSAILGAILIGGGVSLLIAHNWDSFPRLLRLAIGLGLLIATQLLAGFVVLRRTDSVGWREGAGVLNFAAVGGAIAIVSQVYQIQGSFTGYILTWILLSLLPIFALRASLVCALYFIGCAVWLFQNGEPSSAGMVPLLFWVLLAAPLPFLVGMVRQNPFGARAILLLLSFCAALFFGIAALADLANSSLWSASSAGVCTAMYLFGCIWQEKRTSMHPLTALGFLGVCVLSILYSYEFVWRTSPDGTFEEARVVKSVALALLSFFFALPLLLYGWRQRLGKIEANAAAVAFPVVVAVAWALSRFLHTGPTDGPWSLSRGIALGVTAYSLFLGVWTLRRGVHRDRLVEANLGMLVIAVIALFRFFDDEFSFVARGVSFIVVGVGFLVANMMILRRRAAFAQ